MNRRDKRARDTAPVIPCDSAVVEAAAAVLAHRQVGKQAAAQEELAQAIVESAARAAFLSRAGEVTSWQVGPALVVWRESYSRLREGDELPDLLVERKRRVGRSPDWRAAMAAAGDRWPAVAAALGVYEEHLPAEGAIKALARRGDARGVEVAMRCLAAPQIRPLV